MTWIRVLLLSALTSGLIWALSPWITGYREPWDALSHYYAAALAITGLLTGAFSKRIRWAFFVGAVSGQLLYMLVFLQTGPLMLVGILFLCLYSVIFMAAAIAATYLRELVWRKRS